MAPPFCCLLTNLVKLCLCLLFGCDTQASIYEEKDAPLVLDGPGPRVFMDVSFAGGAPRRIEFKLYSSVVPKTAENFRSLCTGAYWPLLVHAAARHSNSVTT